MTHSVGPEELRTYRTEHGIVAALNGVWLPGLFVDRDVARRAAGVKPALLQALSDRICTAHGANRSITAADLDALGEGS